MLLVGPALLYGLGYFLNAFVCGINHGQMPVLFPGGDCSPAIFIAHGDPVHACMSAATHLKFLADWIPMVTNGKLEGMSSPGDFMEDAGLATFYPSLYLLLGTLVDKITKE